MNTVCSSVTLIEQAQSGIEHECFMFDDIGFMTMNSMSFRATNYHEDRFAADDSVRSRLGSPLIDRDTC